MIWKLFGITKPLLLEGALLSRLEMELKQFKMIDDTGLLKEFRSQRRGDAPNLYDDFVEVSSRSVEFLEKQLGHIRRALSEFTLIENIRVTLILNYQ